MSDSSVPIAVSAHDTRLATSLLFTMIPVPSSTASALFDIRSEEQEPKVSFVHFVGPLEAVKLLSEAGAMLTALPESKSRCFTVVQHQKDENFRRILFRDAPGFTKREASTGVLKPSPEAPRRIQSGDPEGTKGNMLRWPRTSWYRILIAIFAPR